MIIVITTPLRIAASYVLAFAAGALITSQWCIGRRPALPTIHADAKPKR